MISRWLLLTLFGWSWRVTGSIPRPLAFIGGASGGAAALRRGSISGTHKRPRPCSRTRHGTPLTLTTLMQAGKPSVSAVATKPPSRVRPTKERRLLNGEEALFAAAPAAPAPLSAVSDSKSPTSDSSNYRPPSWLGRRHTAETRRKMSEVHKKRKPVPWNKGKNLDPALREKIRAGTYVRMDALQQATYARLMNGGSGVCLSICLCCVLYPCGACLVCLVCLHSFLYLLQSGVMRRNEIELQKKLKVGQDFSPVCLGCL